jgi:hypothetical protein
MNASIPLLYFATLALGAPSVLAEDSFPPLQQGKVPQNFIVLYY